MCVCVCVRAHMQWTPITGMVGDKVSAMETQITSMAVNVLMGTITLIISQKSVN